jgi:hypothetical protein
LRENLYWEEEVERVRSDVEEFQNFKEKKITDAKKRKETSAAANLSDKKVREEKLKAL